MKNVPHITVCVCTYQRPLLLRQLLEALAQQVTDGQFTFSVVVADNDASEAARPVVMECQSALPLQVEYVVESRQNIALARNAALARASGDYVAFIDDDEFPIPAWLRLLLATCEQHGAEGVLAPVEPQFEPGTPDWVRRGGFYQRPRHRTGYVMPWTECRTGNVLLRREILAGIPEPFRPEFGSGGEDQDFFRRMMEEGRRFIWCDEAVAYEAVPASRCKMPFLLKRALLRGRNTLRHREGRRKNLLKSCVALPLYAILLPFCLLAGFHWFMKYLIKSADHMGRLLAALRLNPVQTREM